MRPTVSVIIPHFFKARAEHLQRIVADLNAGTVPPGEIVIWNNDVADGLPDLSQHNVTLLQSTEGNSGPQARFKAAQQATGDYILFMDNDTTVCSETVANLLNWLMPDRANPILTLEGRACPSVGQSYRGWPKIYGHDVKSPERVTMSLGRGELVSRNAFKQLVALFPFGPTSTMDDLWWSACAAKVDIPIYVVPAVKGLSNLVNLPRYGTGISATPGYYQRRDETVQDIRNRFGVWKVAA